MSRFSAVDKQSRKWQHSPAASLDDNSDEEFALVLQSSDKCPAGGIASRASVVHTCWLGSRQPA